MAVCWSKMQNKDHCQVVTVRLISTQCVNSTADSDADHIFSSSPVFPGPLEFR